MHVILHFRVVSFTFAQLRMSSFVFCHVCVLGRSYTCVVVSCLGSCVCDAMLESRELLLESNPLLSWKKRFAGCLNDRELG